MRRSDHILALLRALLTASEENLQKTLSVVTEIYELETLRKPTRVSIGAITDHEQNLHAWVLNLRKEHVYAVKFFYAATQKNDLAPHIAAAFAGSQDLLMQIKTEKGFHTLILETYFSPQYQITPQQFILVMDAQKDQHMVWSRIAELVLKSNDLNNKTVFDPKEIKPYLQSSEGIKEFEFLVSELVKEVQIECAVYDHSFIIPAEFQSLFIKYPPLGFDGGDREYVYLYSLRNVTAEEILTLAEAQSFEPKIWEELNKTLESYQDEKMKPMPVAQWKGKLMSLDEEELQRFVQPICRSICILCEDQKLKPIIPARLVDAFGPDELDQKRANARGKDDERWSLQSIQEPWEYYALREIDYDHEVTISSIEEVQNNFVDALQAIHTFANKIQSPFEEAFSLARFIINDLKSISPKEVELEVKDSGFSERAIEVLGGKLWMMDQFTALGYQPAEIKGVLASSIADVFGGMGSWNDQYIETDQEQYETVSANMFEAMKNYFAVIISSH